MDEFNILNLEPDQFRDALEELNLPVKDVARLTEAPKICRRRRSVRSNQ